jgi:hypothetical protein
VVFAALLHDLSPLPVGSSRLFLPACRVNRGRSTGRPPVSSLPLQSVDPIHAGTSRPPKTAVLLLLSWDSLCLPIDISHSASTPTKSPEGNPASAASYHADHSFRPCVFSTLRRLPPQVGREFVAPHNRIEVRYVSKVDGQKLRPKAHSLDQLGPFPAARFTPLEELPSPAAVPCHHGLCLLDCCLSLHISARVRKHAPMQLAPSQVGSSSRSRVPARCSRLHRT